MPKYEEAFSYSNNIPGDGDVELALLRIETLLHLEKKEEANILINETISRDCRSMISTFSLPKSAIS